MDVVEVVLGRQPRAFEVVDDEFHVGWDPFGLDWTEINAGDVRTWELIAH